MPTYVNLTDAEKDRIRRGVEQMNQIMRQTHVYREALGRALDMLAIVSPVLPSDRTGAQLILDFPADTSVPRSKDELVNAYNALRDIQGILNYDIGPDGATHTRVSTTNAELSAWIDGYFILD